MNITEKSTKTDIIDEAVVIITEQDERIESLKGDNKALIVLLSISFASIFIF